MEALRALEERLNIRPLNFNRFKGEIISPEPVKECAKETIKEVEKDYLDTDSYNFKAIAQKWNIDINTVINLFETLVKEYKREDIETQDICKSIFIGLQRNALTRQQINGYINDLNIARGAR